MKKGDDYTKLMTTVELAKKLRVTREAVRLWVLEGCPVVVEKRPRLFDFKAVIQWLNKDRKKNRVPKVS